LKQCRHGKLDWTMYALFHGLPTKVPGSWVPAGDSTGTLLCKTPACDKLWQEEWPAMNEAFSPWEEMQALECDTCKELRAKRCRVRGFDGCDDRHAQQPFTEAPYVVPFNLPKYFAQQLRAMEFAKAAEPPKQLLWIMARDKPFLGDTTRPSAG